MFRHPNYYKELRKRNKSDQVISSESGTPPNERAPDPGLKLQAREDSTANSTRGQVEEPQASSSKQQASSGNRPRRELQAASVKRQAVQDASSKLQAPSCEEQASSHKRQAP